MPEAVESAKKYALVVGINAYSNGIPVLSSAVNDARALAGVLADHHDYRVTCLLDHDASLAGIRTALRALVAAAGPRDRLVFYFAGHGIAEDAADAEDGPRGYFIPQDADRSRTDSFLSMDEVRSTLAQPHVHHLLLLLDCCFAGSFQWSSTRDLRVKQRKLFKERYDRYLREPAWQAIASAAYDERALDVVAGKVLGARAPNHSPFAAACLEGLRDGAADLSAGGRSGDGVTLASELFLHLEQAFFRQEQVTGRRQQTPSLWAFGGPQRASGQFIFERKGADPTLLPSALELKEANNPYRGLAPYGEASAGLFFGREAATRALLEAVQRQVITVVVGASGTGKSSLVMAGALPELRRSEDPPYRILATQRPESAPQAALERLVEQLEQPRTTSLADAVAAFRARDPRTHLVIVIDQLEELVTQTSDGAQRAAFLRAIEAAAGRGAGQLHIVMTLRLDFEAHFSELLAPKADRTPRFLIPHMSREELRQVVERPATERVLFLDPPELVDVLIDEVIDAPGALPLLSFTLSEMYRSHVQAARDDRTLRKADYEALGGVSGALARRADEIYDGLASDAERATMRRMLLRMVVPGATARRPVIAEELHFSDSAENVRVQAIWARLVDARLAASDTDALGRRFIEPAHDKLVTGWPRLQAFIDAEKDSLRLMHALGQAAAQWVAGGHASGLLWDDDPRRAQVLAQRSADPARFNVIEHEFIARSDQRRRRFWISLISAVLAALVSLSAIAAYAWYKRGAAILAQNEAVAAQVETERQRATAVAAQGAAETRLLDLFLEHGRRHMVAGNHLRALPYLSEVYRARSTDPELRWLVGEAARTAAGYSVLAGHAGRVQHLQFFPDGNHLLTAASDDPTPRIWDVPAAKLLRTLEGHKAPILHAALTADGGTAITVARDGQIKRWDVETGSASATMSHCQPDDECTLESAHFVVFGCQLATATESEVRLWNACTDELLAEQAYDRGITFGAGEVQLGLLGHELATPGGQLWEIPREPGKVRLREKVRLSVDLGNPTRFAFAHNGTRVLAIESTGGIGGGPDEWNVDSGTLATSPRGHMGTILAAAYSADDNQLLTAGVDQTARLRLVMTGGDRVLYGHEAEVTDARFDATGTRAITASLDGTARMWLIEPEGNARGSSHLRPVADRILESGTGLVSATFSPSGDRVAAGGVDGTVHLWDTGRRGEPLLSLPDDPSGTDSKQLQFSPDGKRALIANGRFIRRPPREEQAGGTVGVLDLDSRGSIALAEAAPVLGASFVAEASAVVTVGCEAAGGCMMKRWDSATGKALGQRSLPIPAADAAWFSGDGERLALRAASDLVLWDVTGEKIVATVRGLPEGFKSVYWSPDGAMLAGHDTSTAYLWSARDGASLRTLGDRDFSDQVGAKLAWMPDGVTVLVVDGTKLIAWDTGTGAARPSGLDGEVTAIAVAPRGPLAVGMAGYRALTVFEPQHGRALGRVLTDGVDGVEISPDGRWAVTRGWGSDVGQLFLWDLQLETRSHAEISALARCRGPFQLRDGALVRERPEAACARNERAP